MQETGLSLSDRCADRQVLPMDSTIAVLYCLEHDVGCVIRLHPCDTCLMSVWQLDARGCMALQHALWRPPRRVVAELHMKCAHCDHKHDCMLRQKHANGCALTHYAASFRLITCCVKRVLPCDTVGQHLHLDQLSTSGGVRLRQTWCCWPPGSPPSCLQTLLQVYR